MDATQLRSTFTSFFAERGHVAVPSASLIPHHPRAPLFTNAGMNQFIPYYLGEETPPYRRATSIQKCVRIRGKHDDIDMVGRTTRHLSFFEMLGNFSFGDYFKESSHPLGLGAGHRGTGPRRRPDLGHRVHRRRRGGADLARRGRPARRAHPAHGRGQLLGDGRDRPVRALLGALLRPGARVRGGGRSDRRGRGALRRVLEPGLHPVRPAARPEPRAPAAAQHRHRGGLRAAALRPRGRCPPSGRPACCARSSAAPRSSAAAPTPRTPRSDVALRVLADHARSTAFLIADGVLPSNDGRGYVLRRLIRRAVLAARRLGVEARVMPEMAGAVAQLMGAAYPALVDELSASSSRCSSARRPGFDRTLRTGLSLLDEALDAARAGGGRHHGGRRRLPPARHARLPDRAHRGAGAASRA